MWSIAERLQLSFSQWGAIASFTFTNWLITLHTSKVFSVSLFHAFLSEKNEHKVGKLCLMPLTRFGCDRNANVCRCSAQRTVTKKTVVVCWYRSATEATNGWQSWTVELVSFSYHLMAVIYTEVKTDQLLDQLKSNMHWISRTHWVFNDVCWLALYPLRYQSTSVHAHFGPKFQDRSEYYKDYKDRSW